MEQLLIARKMYDHKDLRPPFGLVHQGLKVKSLTVTFGKCLSISVVVSFLPLGRISGTETVTVAKFFFKFLRILSCLWEGLVELLL